MQRGEQVGIIDYAQRPCQVCSMLLADMKGKNLPDTSEADKLKYPNVLCSPWGQ